MVSFTQMGIDIGQFKVEEDFGNNPYRIGKIFLGRKNICKRPFREVSMTDFAPRCPPEERYFTDRVRWKIIVEHKRFIRFPFMERLDFLLIISSPECCYRQGLCFPSCKNR